MSRATTIIKYERDMRERRAKQILLASDDIQTKPYCCNYKVIKRQRKLYFINSLNTVLIAYYFNHRSGYLRESSEGYKSFPVI